MEPTIVASDLYVPWSLAFVPGAPHLLLVTERNGRVRLMDVKKHVSTVVSERLMNTHELGEGGLLGAAFHPDYRDNGWVYFYQTILGPAENGAPPVPENRVVRMQLKRNTAGELHLINPKVLVSGIPAAEFHNGGRLKFGPDHLLYITTGDATHSELAQDLGSLAGKILRVTDDGQPAPGNPFGNPVYAYGIRNSQGLAWDDAGRLFETEHGDIGHDELNRILPGRNYGWPVVQGDETAPGMVAPLLQSGADTWAPSGLAYVDPGRRLYFGGLRGQALYEVVLEETGGGSRPRVASFRALFKREFGRLRDVVVGPDGALYVTTSNRDGRGRALPGDDKILRFDV